MISLILRAATGLAQSFRLVRHVCSSPEAVLRFRFVHIGREREGPILDSFCRVLRAVHRARQDAADLLTGKAPPTVADHFNRWFGGQLRGAPFVLSPDHLLDILDVLDKVHRGLLAKPLLISGTESEDAIASAAGWRVKLGPRYWSEAPPQARADGILFHELTHRYARTTDKALGSRGPLYIHEPDGPDMAYPMNPVTYRDVETEQVGLRPPPYDLVQLADAYECFLEEGYLR